jgi:hypothetical protein
VTNTLAYNGTKSITIVKSFVMQAPDYRLHLAAVRTNIVIFATVIITAMKQCTLKIVSNCLNANIYSFLETSGGQSSYLYFNVVHFFNTSVN